MCHFLCGSCIFRHIRGIRFPVDIIFFTLFQFGIINGLFFFFETFFYDLSGFLQSLFFLYLFR